MPTFIIVVTLITEGNLTDSCFREETGKRDRPYTYPIIDTFGHYLQKYIAPEPSITPNLELEAQR